MTTTTFNQVVRDQTFTITVPVKKVEKLLDRIDNLLHLGKPRYDAKAIQLLKPYIGAPDVKAPSKPVIIKTDNLVEFASSHRAKGRYQVIKALQTEFSISYQKARNVAIKAGVE